jgi:integrase
VEHFNDDYNTYRGKKSSLNKFKDFLNGEKPDERQKSRSVAPTAKDKKCRDLLFSEINLPLIREFEKYLKALGNKTNTVDKELSRLRAIITSAVRDDRMPLEQNPFLKFRLRRERTDKVRLVEAEIEALALLELPTGSLLRDVRNAYLFSYYCAGIRCGDLLNLRWINVDEGILTYTMNKTNCHIRVKIKTNAQTILNEYKSSAMKQTDYIFPFLDNNAPQSNSRSSALAVGNKNPVLNKMLKVLAEKAGINKLLTMHTARHSFADLCRRKTNDLYATSKLLGHSSLRITENYLAHFDPKSVDNTMDSVFE